MRGANSRGVGLEAALAKVHGVDAVELGDAKLVGKLVDHIASDLCDDAGGRACNGRRECSGSRGDDGADLASVACGRGRLAVSDLLNGLLAKGGRVQGQDAVVLHEALIVSRKQR